MDKQKIFTNAAYEYMNEVMDLKDLAKYYNKDASKLIYGYDVILQLSLMHMISLDGEISDLEEEFLSLLVKENDLMDILSKRVKNKTTWSVLKTIPNYNMFLDAVVKLFMEDITEFIGIFTSLDFKTGEDYLNRLKGNIYYISQAILEVDGFDPRERDAYSVLDKSILSKFDEIKKALDDTSAIEVK